MAGAFLRRDVAVLRSYRFPFVLDTFYGILQLAVFFYISRTFVDVGTADLNGAPDYFAFAAVGVVISLVTEAATQGVADRIRDGQVSGTLETLMTQPLTMTQLSLGLMAWPFAFSIVRSAAYLAIAVVAMGLESGNADWLGLGLVLVATGTALGMLGIIAGAAVLVFKRGQVIGGVLLFGMTLITGATFPVSALPDWLADIGSVLPLKFAIDGARDALFNGSQWGPDVAVLVVYTAAGLPFAIWLFGRALEAARRNGSVGHY